jgi:hypothetical protein
MTGTLLSQPPPSSHDAPSKLSEESGLAWDRAIRNTRGWSTPDSELLRALYNPVKDYVPAELRDTPHVVLPLRSPSRIGLYRPPPRAPQARVTAVEKLRLSERQIRRARRTRLEHESAASRLSTFDRFQLFSQWEGNVLAVDERSFRATVLLTDRQGRRHRRDATFPTRLVRDADRDLLQPGATFYYCVGRFLEKGQAVPTSVVWFRRIPPSGRSVDEALARGAEWSERIGWTS